MQGFALKMFTEEGQIHLNSITITIIVPSLQKNLKDQREGSSDSDLPHLF